MSPNFPPTGLDRVEDLAVAVGYCDRNAHTIVAYRHRKKNHASDVRVLHFVLNGFVVDDLLDSEWDGFVWCVPDLPRRLLKNIAVFCAAVGKSGARFNYRFNFAAGTRLKWDGSCLKLSGSAGVTCATFVLALFEGIQATLLRIETVERREDDDQWMRRFVEGLRRHARRLELDPDEVERIAAELPCARIRPFDVLGACRIGGHATHFHAAWRVGEGLQERLGQECLRSPRAP